MTRDDVTSCPKQYTDGDCLADVKADGFDWIEECHHYSDLDCLGEIVSCWVDLSWGDEYVSGDCEEMRQKMNKKKENMH